MIQHIIWDFDGTLFDSYPPMTTAFVQALTEAGVQETYDHVISMMKISAGTLIEDVRNRFGLGDAFLARYHSIQAQVEHDTLCPFPHAANVCAQIRESGRTNDLYTHRGNSAILHLERLGMHKDFRDFVTGEDDFPRKPDPSALLHLVEKHGMSKDMALMVGDRDIDLQAGRNAGIHTCLFHPNPTAASPYADFVISDLRQLLELIH